MAGLGRPLIFSYELPFWDLTTVTVWVLMREPGAARMAKDQKSPYALHDAKAAHVDRMRDVWDLLWGESGRPKPDDPNEASVELLCDDPAVEVLLSSSGTPAGGSSLAGGFRDRRNEKEKRAALLRRLEAEGAIQLHWPFPIDDYLMELIRKGRLEIRTRRFGGEAMTAIGLDECAILEIAGDIDERCYFAAQRRRWPRLCPSAFQPRSGPPALSGGRPDHRRGACRQRSGRRGAKGAAVTGSVRRCLRGRRSARALWP